MKRFLFILALPIALLQNVSAQADRTIFFETTDSLSFPVVQSSDCAWQIGQPSKTLFDTAYSPIRALMTDTILPYGINVNCSYTIKLNLGSLQGSFEISFKHRYDTEFKKDGGVVELFNECDQTWGEILSVGPLISTHCIDGLLLVFLDAEIPNDTITGGINAYTGNSQGWQTGYITGWCYGMVQDPNTNRNNSDTLSLRFRFISDSIDSGHEGWMIDDVRFRYLGKCTTGMDEYNPGSFTLLPNPASNSIAIDYTGPEAFQLSNLELYSFSGQLLHAEIIMNPHTLLSVEQLPKGLYLIKIIRGDQIHHLRFVKE